MQPKGPSRWHGWLPNHFLVLAEYSLRAGASKEVQLHNTTYYPAHR
jgi:hypothetical protein